MVSEVTFFCLKTLKNGLKINKHVYYTILFILCCTLRGRWSNANGHREFGASLTCDPKLVVTQEKYQNVDNDDI